MSKRAEPPKAAANLKATRRWFRLRPRVWGLLLLLVAGGVGAQFLWQRAGARVARHPQYVLTAERVQITQSPPWIRSDIKMQVLRDAGLDGNISVLDDWTVLSRRVKEAFEFHPWVASVERITKRLPASLEIELTYRRPIAAVESNDGHGVAFLPVDARGVRLPEADLTDTERRYLPRISGVTGRPLVGDAWTDQRVIEGAKLIAGLTDIWQQLWLVEITAALRSPPRGETPLYSFEMVTRGGTRILWGTSPGQESAAGESPFDQKRKRLLDYAIQHGRLESIDGPAAIDVRSDLVVTPRTARKKNGIERK
jgi:hypothetical protein